MDKKYEKIILPPDYQQMPAPALAELGAQMEARVRQIDEQISDAMKKNPNMAPDRFGSIDWHTRARRAQDIYRRDINSINQHIIKNRRTFLELTPASDTDKINAAFRKVSQRRLTETLYKGILEEARQEVGL